MNHKGQIFEIYLVVVIGFMCALVIFLYFTQQSEARNSLVSPKTVLESRDALEIFELREEKFISEALEETKKTIKFEEEFAKQFRENLLNKIKSNEDMKEFLFINYVYEIEARANEESFLESIYSAEYDVNKNIIILTRAKLEKRSYLNAEKKNKINFPLELSFTIEKEYLISFKEDKFTIEEK